ncbi:ATP-binding protein [Desulfuromonas sp. DDH964]|uniref:ATP-binding protein n=1 Tax=Desulfuromonas sp. DDH964 TaxID=1823759 RepID=UPI0009EF29ED|nr:ATP-binding protein [Desulfuromonas sp. DDH964]
MNTDRNHKSKSAGIGDPYWYEWGIGLLKAVEMLNPDSDIDAVAFQKDGIKGWDDIVIRFSSGHQDYYQVKHSRPRSNLTFSDLVSKGESGTSLLGSLSSAWHKMGLCGTDTSCILITNRSAGTRSSRSKSGTFFPPLARFIEHLSAELGTVTSLEAIRIPDEWGDAWDLWLTEMGDIAPDEKLHFLRAVTISTEAPQLDEMQDGLASSLSATLGITNYQAVPLVRNLLSALLHWTTSLRGTKEWVTAEDVLESLAESEPDIFGYCDVPTPMPFFPSREAAVDEITDLLTSNSEHQIVFLEADPGSGKTSVVSRIVNQRADNYSKLIVDIRYYAYRPITPDSPALSADADRSASSESLWYSLLSQIRERLRGRLLQLRVPVRNHFITPDQARDHVLRLSSFLAQEKHAPFVIVIDGIDHAARAHRKGLPSLMQSLPAPEAIPKGVRILIAGQPATGYPEYPIWLRSRHELVASIGLGPLEIQDTHLLLSSSTTRIPADDLEHVARLIHDIAGGNTLAAVFSVAEAERCQTLDELQGRLTKRQLHSGVHAYYQAIWTAAIPASPTGISLYLSAVLCILKERITGTIMHQAFPAWGKPAPEWDAILSSLEPLVVHDEGGFRVRHNDIRVFLERELSTDDAALRSVASLLADYYMSPSADPYFRQESLFNLLQIADRDTEKARIFNPAWVLDAAAYGRNLSSIQTEAEEAFRAIPDLKDWDAALSVACGGMTLAKLSDCVDSNPDLLVRTDTPLVSLPQCVETERFVLPLSRWDDGTVRQVLSDARMLAEKADINRARGLIEHWFSGISPMAMVASVSGMTDYHEIHESTTLAVGVDALLEDWGDLAFRLEILTDRGDPNDYIGSEATCLFEKGWVSACVASSEQEEVAFASLMEFNPLYLRTFEVALEEASKKGMWNLVGRLLQVIFEDRGRLHLDFRIKAAYWALKALGEDGAKDWLEVIQMARTGQCADRRIEMPLMLYVARVIGWVEPQREASGIASELATAIISQNRHVRDQRSFLLPLRAAAMSGLIGRMLSKGNPSGAAALVPSQTVRTVIEFIWEARHSLDFHDFRDLALNLTFALLEQCQEIGNTHAEMVLSLSLSSAEKFPVDQRLPVLWEILRRAGHRELLYNWAEHWIGKKGAVWFGTGYSERVEIVGKLSHSARKEGWDELAATAETKLRHHLIGYSSHKDYSFQEALDWFEELARRAPIAWCQEGMQLLDICRECDDQGGDNRLISSIEAEIAAAAFHCGPNNAWAFFNSIDPETERYWLQTVRKNLIAAINRIISDGTVTDSIDMLTLWSCAVGLTRWFDKYQVQLITELRDSILAAVSSEDRKKLHKRMQSLTPGEVLREEYEKDRPSQRTRNIRETATINSPDAGEAVSKLAQQVAGGYEPSLVEIGQLAIQIARDNPENRTELMYTLLGLVDANRNYGRRWGYWEEEPPLRELIPALREYEVWELMRAAVRPMGEAFWFHSGSYNVHLICLFHAAGKGTEGLKRGTQCVLAMHRLWSRLPESQNAEVRDLSADNTIETWPRFAALVLLRMLTADSAETVSAALRGLSAVVETSPEILRTVLDYCKARERSWLLLGMEIWAARHPEIVASTLEEIWAQDDGELRTRIQLWLCKLMLSKVAGGEQLTASFMPAPTSKSEEHSSIITKPQKLLEISPISQGSTKLANVFSAARTWISRMATITGHDTEGLESRIAEAIISQDPAVDKIEKHKNREHFAAEDGDMIITGREDGILDNAFTRELRRTNWSEDDATDIAVALTHGDDPWVVRQSPLPSPASFDWPEQKEVEEWIESGTNNKGILNRLRLLASGSDLPDGKVALGSCLRLFTSHYDFEMRYWLDNNILEGVAAKHSPTCPSGRCFQFFFPNRFEPRADSSPLVFFSGSLLLLSFSTLELIPARFLQERLKWEPSTKNPLKWYKDGRLVAKYERYHGPLDYNWSRRHMRQPTLSRWVVRAESLTDIPRLTPQWNHMVHRFSER